MTYFRKQLPAYYRPRWPVSLLSSKWDQVVPNRTNHQDNTLKNSVLKYLHFKNLGRKNPHALHKKINKLQKQLANKYQLTNYQFLLTNYLCNLELIFEKLLLYKCNFLVQGTRHYVFNRLIRKG